MRVFAFFEYDQYLPQLTNVCTPKQFFRGTGGEAFMQGFSDKWWRCLRFSPYRGYVYVTRFVRVNHLISKLATSVLCEEDFNQDWSLTEHGCRFRDRLRKRWEHRIKIGDQYFYFSSARQLLNVILDQVEDYLTERCDKFVQETNEQIDDLFGSVEFDGVPACGEALRAALGLRQLPEHHGLMMTLRQELYQKGHEKNASNLIRKFSEEPIENLVSNDYLERIVGLIQTQSSEDEP